MNNNSWLVKTTEGTVELFYVEQPMDYKGKDYMLGYLDKEKKTFKAYEKIKEAEDIPNKDYEAELQAAKTEGEKQFIHDTERKPPIYDEILQPDRIKAMYEHYLEIEEKREESRIDLDSLDEEEYEKYMEQERLEAEADAMRG